MTFCHLLKPQCLNKLEELFEFHYKPNDKISLLVVVV